MQINSITIELRGNAIVLDITTTRSQLIELAGEPDDIGGFGRKTRRGQILKYDATEFHFMGDKDADCLFLIYSEHDVSGELLPNLCIKLGENQYGASGGSAA